MDASTQSPTSSPKVFDISTRRMSDRCEVVLMDPAAPGQQVDTGGRITILSPRSAEARAASDAFPFTRDADGNIDTAVFERSLLEQTIAVTVGAADWNLREGDAEIPCTEEYVRQVFTDPQFAWIQAQVQARYLAAASFFGDSTTR